METIVVKVGTSSLLDKSGELDQLNITRLLEEMAELMRRGNRVIFVTSGAIGAGRTRLGHKDRPATLPDLQATAAVGQAILMNLYNSVLKDHKLSVAQILLTHEDFQDRRRYLNIRNTIAALHGKPVLPVINENDTVATDEIRFGDNDVLAALVAGLVDARRTILLSDVEGFYLNGSLIPSIDAITLEIEEAAGPPGSSFGRGGMASKIRAAKLITRAGGTMILAHGRHSSLLAPAGTVFLPVSEIDQRARWIDARRESGSVSVDEGGRAAIAEWGKSLLPAGIKKCDGDFDAGDTILILSPEGRAIAKGLTNYASPDVRRIMGHKTKEIPAILGGKSFDEVIHRDNLVLL